MSCQVHVSPTVGCQDCMVPLEEGPDDGHTFRISIESRGSYRVVGEAQHHDAEEFMGGVRTVEVRAWNLLAALRKAAELPMIEWFREVPDVCPSCGKRYGDHTWDGDNQTGCMIPVER